MRVERVKSDNFGGESFQERAKQSTRDVAPNETVPRLIRTLVCHRAQEQHLSCCFRDLLIRKSLPENSAVRHVPVWLVQESCLREELSVKMGHKKPKKFHNLAC